MPFLVISNGRVSDTFWVSYFCIFKKPTLGDLDPLHVNYHATLTLGRGIKKWLLRLPFGSPLLMDHPRWA